MWNLFNLEEQYANLPAIKREDIQKLMQWLEGQPHLPKMLEHEALCFFHACDRQVEYTKQVIDACYTFRTHNEDFFGNVDIETPQMKQVLKTVAGFPLEKRTPEGYIVMVGKLIDTDASKFDFTNSLKLYCLGQDMMLLESPIAPGITVVFDLDGLTFGHIARIGLTQLKSFLYFVQEAIPTRLISVHFVNAGSIIERVMALINPFIKKELKNAFRVHKSLDSLYEFIPRDILPQEFGGPEMHSKDLTEIAYQKLRDNRLEIIAYNNSHRVNEKLRTGKTKNDSKLFGIEGNFKKLDID